MVSLKPCGRGMVLETLRYADEVHKAQGYFRDIADDKPDPELLDLATALIDKKTAPFHPDEYHDRYVDALKRLVEEKRAAKGGKVIEEADDKPSRASNVVDLMAALKKSMERGGTTPAEDAPAPKPARKAKAPEPANEDTPAPAKKPARKAAAAKPKSEEAAPAAPARKTAARKRA